MFTRTISALASAALTAGTLALATPARAADTDEVAIAVPIGDLDLGDRKDVARLERRVRTAAKQICGSVPARDLSMQAMVVSCQSQVLANARADVETAIAAARASGDRLALRTR